MASQSSLDSSSTSSTMPGYRLTEFVQAIPTRTKTASVQLPDLLSASSSFQLRTNRHCRSVSVASEKWLRDVGVDVGANWKKVKVGLLAAVCYPRADPTQLRFATDFLSLLISADDHGYDGTYDPFAHLSDRLSRAGYRNPAWCMRFHRSLRAYREARNHLAQNAQSDVVPDLESYVELRRDASGFRMAFDLVEYAGGLELPEQVFGPAMLRLIECACDIVAWSEDIASCARVQSAGKLNRHTIVSVLMKERDISLAAALMEAGALVQQSIDAFLAAERLLPSWSNEAVRNDTRLFVQGLRDWISGAINWYYESERYFGDKGTEVRMFGWVFLPVKA
ncbi:isoprenoid synthase domain-containing protein [Hygrophoropsis aurantiaca]|uniref:Isoprenoid synthase domain-containing protein n=1 Tax=Hygrophoropsis aurantiaca TaxID=72124 RepID=A0ACB8ABL5_9AGAM|nr:isoprenoid synthase domain-containing protein [Hygrophoropsis aurantiaca]